MAAAPRARAPAEEEEIREVWASNLHAEFPLILASLKKYPCAAIDTEFPGFLHFTPRFAAPAERYRDVRRNVDGMKLLQLGISCFDRGGARRRTWQISFRDFDISRPSDGRSEASLEMLKRSGLDFARTRKEGVESAVLSELLRRFYFTGRRRKPLWVTFQGLYDVAFMVKLLTAAPLPATLGEFARLAAGTLGRIVDVKHLVMRFCGEFDIGLAALSKSLGLVDEGVKFHQAGIDSLITGMIFERMKEMFGEEEEGEMEGILHGIEEERIVPWREEESEEMGLLSSGYGFRGDGRQPGDESPGFFVGRVRIFLDGAQV